MGVERRRIEVAVVTNAYVTTEERAFNSPTEYRESV